MDGIITPEAITKMKEGLEIGINGIKYKTLPCSVRTLTEKPVLPERAKKIRDERHGPTSWISVTLTEGKFRQVKKMTACVGFPTLRLVRIRIGSENLDDLLPGKIKEVVSFHL